MINATKEFLPQEQELIYALDIGTRSIIGMLGKAEGERVHILAIEKQPHESRAMLDGQIEDIDQVAKTVIEITHRLELSIERKLTQVCVAAAGRSLRTEQGYSLMELPSPEVLQDEHIQRLTAEAVANAEQTLKETETQDQQLFLVGYTVTQFLLDRYPMSNLRGHTGKTLEAHVVATFLPSGVVDSLNAVIQKSGLKPASLTLEPIAALNAAIPAELRLLNLALVDIGAGTSDIAVCRDGGVVGYTMATVAGDEITEALMREYLIDFKTAEQIKAEIATEETIQFSDILGIEQSYSVREILSKIEPAVQNLVQEISQHILQLNGGSPSALFLAGGGSKLSGLCNRIAEALKIDRKRVALAGNYFKTNAYSDTFDLNDPEYTTPLGIAISSCLGLISDSYRVFLNGIPAKLFRSGQLTVLDILMMNGYSYADLLGHNGKNLVLYIDGKRNTFHGAPALPAQLTVNGVSALPSMIVYAGDKIEFIPAKDGDNKTMLVGELKNLLSVTDITENGTLLPDDYVLKNGSYIETIRPSLPPQSSPQKSIPEEVSTSSPSSSSTKTSSPDSYLFYLNGKELHLSAKNGGAPYYLMDLLELSGLDFEHITSPVTLKVNGVNGLFQQVLQNGDRVEIYDTDPTKVS